MMTLSWPDLRAEQNSMVNKRASTNIQRLAAAADSLARMITDTYSLAGAEPLLFNRKTTESALEAYVYDRMEQELMLEGVHLLIADSEPQPSVLSVRLEQAAVYYDRIHEGGLFQDRVVDRTVVVKTRALLSTQEETGRLFTVSLKDSFPLLEREEVEKDGALLGRIDLPDSGLDRWAEVVISTATFGLIAYLFYKARSR